MYSVILCGGSGTRLWPVSRHHFPKQFHTFGGESSLFQATVRRCAQATGSGELIVLCNKDYRFLAAEQLDEIGFRDRSIVLEPASRNTAPAIALAALAVSERSRDEIMLVAPSDHAIEHQESFNRTVATGIEAARAGKLVTLGIKPQYPATGYGYIRRRAESRETCAGRYYDVEKFVEKPDAEKAAEFVASGEYYWNSGIFIFKAGTYLDELEHLQTGLLEVCRAAWRERSSNCGFVAIDELYNGVESISVDYAVMEHTRSSVVVSHEGDWNDIGTWNGVTQKKGVDEHGNAVSGNVVLRDVANSLVLSSDRLVAGVGLENTVVVETKDAVLVAGRQSDQDVKHIVEHLRMQSALEADFHTRVLRPWGAYENLDGGQGFHVKRLTIKPGASISLQRHYHRSEHWVVVKGVAKVTRNEEQFELKKNESTYIPREAVHKLANEGPDDLLIIEVQTGDHLDENDIERLEDDYGRV